MSVWRAKRQLVYMGSIALVIIVALVLGYLRFFNEPPTCIDGKQNGLETSVDVGGDCPILDAREMRSIVPLWERAFPVTSDVYNAVAYFENQNIGAGVQQLPYRFRLYDEKNIIVAERTGTTFIEPNGRSAIFEPSLQTGNREPVYVFFEFLQPPVWHKTEQRFDAVQLVVEDKILENAEAAPRLSATIRNRTLDNLQAVDVVAILYNAKNNAIASSKTVIPSIAQNASIDIFFTWPEAFAEEVVQIEIIPRVNPFVNNNRI